RKARESGYYGGIKKNRWNRPDGDIYHYKIVNKDILSEKALWIDFGFHFYQKITEKGFVKGDGIKLKKEQKSWISEKQSSNSKTLLYHYLGYLERIIDCDTLLVQIDLGFGITLRERIRLLGVNAPELLTPDGEVALKSLKKKLKPGSVLLIRTHFQDKYGRYLGDVLYVREKKANVSKLKAEGIHLNEELSNHGY
ncbi:thermonuclease family protein, partial [Leptospira sp. 201903070]